MSYFLVCKLRIYESTLLEHFRNEDFYYAYCTGQHPRCRVSRKFFFFFISLLLFGIHRHLRSAGAVFDRPPQRRPFSTAAALTTDLCISLSTSRVAPINSGLPVTRRPSQ